MTDQYFLNYLGRLQEKAIYKKPIFWDILASSNQAGSSTPFKVKFELKRIDLADV